MTQITSQKYQELYDEFKNQLLSASEKIVKDQQLAEDVIQEVFLRLGKQDFDKIESYIDRWLFLVCRNCSIKKYHKRNRYVLFENVEDLDCIDESGSAPEGMMFNELSTVMLRLLKNLSKNQQTAIKLRYFKDYSYNEIAKRMKIQRGNVGFMISDGLRRLKKFMDEENKKLGLY
jgi:RNA polymerase sigma-70 factor (ECF subfamily)